MTSGSEQVVILGTGGTIAARADDPADALRYRAAQIGVEALVRAVPPLQGMALQAEQVAQIDSKDMSPAVWQALAHAVQRHLRRPEVGGVVVTHGTDTLEETAFLLHRLLAPAKPVVLTAAMRPASSLQADGPQNLLDAVCVARTPGARGVVVVMGGTVFHPASVRKTHTWKLQAFSSGDDGPIGYVLDGALHRCREWPDGTPAGLGALPAAGTPWPRVEIVTSHAGADGRVVDLLCEDGVRGLVLAGTGHGTLAAPLEQAAYRALARGVRVVRASRCAAGMVVAAPHDGLEPAGPLGPAQARIALILELLQSPVASG